MAGYFELTTDKLFQLAVELLLKWIEEKCNDLRFTVLLEIVLNLLFPTVAVAVAGNKPRVFDFDSKSHTGLFENVNEHISVIIIVASVFAMRIDQDPIIEIEGFFKFISNLHSSILMVFDNSPVMHHDVRLNQLESSDPLWHSQSQLATLVEHIDNVSCLVYPLSRLEFSVRCNVLHGLEIGPLLVTHACQTDELRNQEAFYGCFDHGTTFL